jgi:hypothetical protein
MLQFEALKSGVRMLVKTDDWFPTKNGQSYQAVWGLCRVIAAKTILGFEPRNSANWALIIGTGDDAVFVSGCRVHYAQVCEDRPMGNSVLCLDEEG